MNKTLREDLNAAARDDPWAAFVDALNELLEVAGVRILDDGQGGYVPEVSERVNVVDVNPNITRLGEIVDKVERLRTAKTR